MYPNEHSYAEHSWFDDGWSFGWSFDEINDDWSWVAGMKVEEKLTTSRASSFLWEVLNSVQ